MRRFSYSLLMLFMFISAHPYKGYVITVYKQLSYGYYCLVADSNQEVTQALSPTGFYNDQDKLLSQAQANIDGKQLVIDEET